MRTESAGVDLKVDGEEGSWGGNGMSTGTGHVCIFRCAGRLLPLPVARAGCMATVAMKLSYVSFLESGGGCVVPNAIEYRRLRTCQLAYYGRMGLGIKYRQIGRDELCTSGPNLELGGALVPPEKNKAKPREGCP